jgi:pimeloyl-ACP methyl ester carboxylesterase
MATDRQFAQRTISTPKLDIAILEAGDPNAPLALCLHGFPDTAYTWRHLLPELVDAGYHAVAPFMRGYAPTAVAADGCYHAGALVADATALHDALNADGNAVLIGHDWGAMATYGTGAFGPDRWRRLVTMAVPPPASLAAGLFTFPQIKRSFYMFFFQTAFAEPAVMADDFAFIDGLWRDWTIAPYDFSEDARLVKQSLASDANVSAAVGYYRAMLGTTTGCESYGAEQQAATEVAPQPTLYLHGSDDAALGADIVVDPDTYLSQGSRSEFVEGANHFLHLERPEYVNRKILEWISG